ncbi:MAG: hypothetical protein R3Y45_00605 [Bacillota bacterium]
MTKSIKKITAYILVVALLLSLMGCSSSLDEPTPNTSPEMTVPEGEFAEGEMPFGDIESGFGGVTPEATETPTATVSPGSGTDVVVKEVLSDANGVYLYSYDSVFTSVASNYVVIRMDDEALLSKDLFITEINLVSYSGDADFDDEEIIPEIDDAIQINETTMQTSLFNAGYTVKSDDDDDEPFLFALAREDDGDYYVVEYGTSGWQTVEDGIILDSDEEIYIGLALLDSGSYEVQISFEIKDSQNAYNFGYFDKEVEDGEEFTLTAYSKISKAKAEVYVMVQIEEYVDESDDIYASQYVEITDDVDSYIRVEVDGEEDSNALDELTKIVDIDEVYLYIYNDSSLSYGSSSSKSDIILAFMETEGVSTSVNEDNHIDEADLMWVNYEFTIYDGTWYVFDDSGYYYGDTSGYISSVTSAIDKILNIGYDSDTKDFEKNEDAITTARNLYDALSESEQAYLLALQYSEDDNEYNISQLYYGVNDKPADYNSSEDTAGDNSVHLADSFETWFSFDAADGKDSYTGYDLIAYLEDAEDYLDELEVVSGFETVLENYDLLWDTDDTTPTGTFTWGTYTNKSISDTLMIEVNTGSSTQVSNLETVISYLDELSDDDRAVIEAREPETYAYIEYLEYKIITDDVEYVMSEISAVVASYLVSAYTNTLLYVDLVDVSAAGDYSEISYTLGLDATHMVYSQSLFTAIENAYNSYFDLSPEKQEMLAKYTLTVTDQGNTESSASSYSNYYYFNESIIDKSTLEITYEDAIFALYEMMEITENLQTLFSYIDYTSYFDTDIAKERYVDLVFGTSDGDYNHLMYGNETSLFDNSDYDYSNEFNTTPDENWAIYDLAKAYSESEYVQDAIIAEYIEFIELLIYIEEYKLDIADEFENMMYEEISTDNDYSTKTISQMASDLDDYIDAILEEDTVVMAEGMTNVITYLFTEGFSDMDEAKELIEECFDVEDMVEYMIKTKGYTEE